MRPHRTKIGMNKIITFLLIIILNMKGFGQPTPFKGTLLFNLTETEYTGSLIKKEEFISKKIKILSRQKDSELKYDTIHNAFSFTTNGTELKEFAIVYNNDTIFIDYPSLPRVNEVHILMPIPLNGKSFSFSNEFTYDAMHSNANYNKFKIFYLCQGCFLSTQYEMTIETKKKRSKRYLTNEVKLEE